MVYKVLYKLSGLFNYLVYGKYVLGWGIRLRSVNTLKLGKDCTFESGVVLNAYKGELTLGNRISVNFNTVISAGYGKVRIDDDVLIGPNVIIRSSNHMLSKDRRQEHEWGEVYIGKNVWIGAGAVILPNVVIGQNSIIGAGSVVTKNIESNSIYVGNPAKKIKDLNI